MKKLLLFLFVTLFLSTITTAQVTYNVTVPSGTNACYIAGDFSAPYPNWGQIEMTKVDDTHYTITISNATTANVYKYCSGPAWNYKELQADCSTDVANRTYNANDVVACWASVWVPDAPKVDINIKVNSPWGASTYLYYWGDASNVWPGDVMTQINNSTIYEYTINQVASVSILFNNGSGTQTADINNVTSSRCYEVFSDGTYTTADCNSLLIISATESTEKSQLIFNSIPSQLTLEIAGKSNASLYTLQGALINKVEFENTYTFTNLKAGMYLLDVNGKTYKALVK